MRPHQIALHRKKVWKKMSSFDRCLYYVKPFLIHFGEVWMQPLPFPTLFKIVYSVFLLAVTCLPLIYPSFILILYWGIFQYLMERHTAVKLPKKVDLIGTVTEIFTTEPEGIYKLGVKFHFDRVIVLSSSFISAIDYIRIVMNVLN
ncbi:uncharacterized protein LOC119661763 [Hermetia illucens]|uniref:uncharacterized protein LOC119661763 n=1 Tax=Hermetia illucens TaxID=343691 RepID=UPI0018CC5188|nr:uncharacterized protein LOC119661763 [Hermetia illucens]